MFSQHLLILMPLIEVITSIIGVLTFVQEKYFIATAAFNLWLFIIDSLDALPCILWLP